MATPELIVIGLACNLVGIFLLANSIVFRSPRHLLGEFFGVGKGTLRPLRDYILNKIQVIIAPPPTNGDFIGAALLGGQRNAQAGGQATAADDATATTTEQ